MTNATLEVSRSAGILSDDQWMAALDDGDVEAGLRALKERYDDRVHRLIEGIVRDRHLAEDLTQEVFAKVFLKSRLYRAGSKFRAWLFEIARNQARSALRARRYVPQPFGSLEKAGGDRSCATWLERLGGTYEDQSLRERELMGLFGSAVGRLPARYQEVFRLCVQDGTQYQDAARALGIPVGTVAIRILRARRRLFRELSPHVGHIRRSPACARQAAAQPSAGSLSRG